MRRRWLGLAAVGAFVVAALAGCSVPLSGLMALHVEDDRVVGDVVMCPEFTASEIHMLPQGGGSILRLFPHPTWTFEQAQISTIDLGSVSEFTDSLGDSGSRFEVSASGGVILTPDVDEAMIESLGVDEYLVRPQRTEVVVSLEEFERHVAEICDY